MRTGLAGARLSTESPLSWLPDVLVLKILQGAHQARWHPTFNKSRGRVSVTNGGTWASFRSCIISEASGPTPTVDTQALWSYSF